LAAGTSFGDVAMAYDGVLSAGLGLVGTVAVASVFFDYMLKFGTEEACIISSTTGKEVCGHLIDGSEDGCVLTANDGWQCAA